MDVAYGLAPLVAAKLVVYTFGTLVHLFLMMLCLTNGRLLRLELLLFALMCALFLWYSGNLLALNVSLFYGAPPAILSGFSRTISIVGFMLAVPVLVHVQAEYGARVMADRFWLRFLAVVFYLPLLLCPWILRRLLEHLGWEPLAVLGSSMHWLILWAVAALMTAAWINAYLSRQAHADAVPRRFHAYLAALQGVLSLGCAVVYLPQTQPPVGGLGGYFATALMLTGILPSVMVGYAIVRDNFLDLRLQRNVLYAVAAGFGFLIYLSFMRRLSGWLEAHDALPAAVTEGVMIFILVVLVEPLKRLVSRALRQQFVSEFEIVQKLASEIEDHAKRTGDVEALQAFVEDRVPRALGLEWAKLWPGPAEGTLSAGVRHVPISRGGKAIAYLDVMPAGGEISGERAAALEVLADRLAGALEVCQLIADKVKLERELATRERMAFLGEMAARIAHNVKNPLSGMKTLVQLMEENQALPEDARRDCGMLVAEIDRLNRNISQVLRYAKPARDTDREADLLAIVNRIASIYRMEAEKRRIAVEIEGAGPCAVEGGEEAASDIVSNLLVNALEASADGGLVRIVLVPMPDYPRVVQMTIEDRGRGIPNDRLDKIFQPFFTTRAGGTGLGLAIVKRRVEEIGGFVDCQSPTRTADPDNPGTQFTVRFRAAQMPMENARAAQDADLGHKIGLEPQSVGHNPSAKEQSR